MSKKKTRNALEMIERKVGDDPEQRAEFEREMLAARISQLAYSMRKAAEMTQQELADAIGTTQSVISRLEDADNDHAPSLKTVQRIAIALDTRAVLEINPTGARLVEI